jgi:hypothetical protein
VSPVSFCTGRPAHSDKNDASNDIEHPKQSARLAVSHFRNSYATFRMRNAAGMRLVRISLLEPWAALPRR